MAHCGNVREWSSIADLIPVHVLVLLASEPDTQQTSTDVALKLDTNSVVIRRTLASLQRKSVSNTTQSGRPS
jgi:hypothetical protein